MTSYFSPRGVTECQSRGSVRPERLSGDILPDLVDKANHTIGAIRYAPLPLYRKCTTGMLEYYREQYEAARAAREGIG